mmetsp:Transcript_42918/g.100769  ORF Transcript_42918/g.100769 Transcript_42918/m.100769 type:complete len:1595 (+) Transcript_42918:228-5012(+)
MRLIAPLLLILPATTFLQGTCSLLCGQTNDKHIDCAAPLHEVTCSPAVAGGHSLLSIATQTKTRVLLSQAKAKVASTAAQMEDAFNHSSDELVTVVTKLVQQQASSVDSQLQDRCAAEILQVKDVMSQLHHDLRSLVTTASAAGNEAPHQVRVIDGCLMKRAEQAKTLGLLRKDRDELWELGFTLGMETSTGAGAAAAVGASAPPVEASGPSSLEERMAAVQSKVQETKQHVADLVACLSSSLDRASCKSQQSELQSRHSVAYGELSQLVDDYQRAMSARSCEMKQEIAPVSSDLFNEVPEDSFIAWDMQPRLDSVGQAEQSARHRVEAIATQCGPTMLSGLSATTSSLAAVRGALAALRESQDVILPKHPAKKQQQWRQVSSEHGLSLKTGAELEMVLASLRTFDWTLKRSLTFDEVTLLEGDQLVAKGDLDGVDIGDVPLLSPSPKAPVQLIFQRSAVEVLQDDGHPAVDVRVEQETPIYVETFASTDNTSTASLCKVQVKQMMVVRDAAVLQALQEAMSGDGITTADLQVGNLHISRGSHLLQEGSAVDQPMEKIGSLQLPAGLTFSSAEYRKQVDASSSHKLKLSVKTSDSAALTLLAELVNRSDSRLTQGMQLGMVSLLKDDILLDDCNALTSSNLAKLSTSVSTPVKLTFLREVKLLDAALALEQESEVVVASAPKVRQAASARSMGSATVQVRELLMEQRLDIHDRSSLLAVQEALTSSDSSMSHSLQRDTVTISKGSRLVNVEELERMLQHHAASGSERFSTPVRLLFQYNVLQPGSVRILDEKVAVNIASLTDAATLAWALSSIDGTVQENVQVGDVELQEGDRLKSGLSANDQLSLEQLVELYRQDPKAAADAISQVLPIKLVFMRQTVRIVHNKDAADDVFVHRLDMEEQDVLTTTEAEEQLGHEKEAVMLDVGASSASLRKQQLRMELAIADGAILAAISGAVTAEHLLRMAVHHGDVELPKGSKLLLEAALDGKAVQDLPTLTTPATLIFLHEVWAPPPILPEIDEASRLQLKEDSRKLTFAANASVTKFVLAALSAPDMTVNKAVAVPIRPGHEEEVVLMPGDQLLSATNFEVSNSQQGNLPSKDIAELEKALLSDPQQQQVKFLFARKTLMVKCPQSLHCAVSTSLMDVSSLDVGRAEAIADSQAVVQHTVVEVSSKELLHRLKSALDRDWRMRTSVIVMAGNDEDDIDEVLADVPAGSQLLKQGMLSADASLDVLDRLQVPANLTFARWVLRHTATEQQVAPSMREEVGFSLTQVSAQGTSEVLYNLGAQGRRQAVPAQCNPCSRHLTSSEDDLVQGCLAAGGKAKLCNCLDVYCTKSIPLPPSAADDPPKEATHAVDPAMGAAKSTLLQSETMSDLTSEIALDHEEVFFTAYISSVPMLQLLAASFNRSTWTLTESVQVGKVLLEIGDTLMTRGSLQDRRLDEIDNLRPEAQQPARLLFQRTVVRARHANKGESAGQYVEASESSGTSFLNQPVAEPLPMSMPQVAGASMQRMRRKLEIADTQNGRSVLAALQEAVNPSTWKLQREVSVGGLQVPAGMQLLQADALKNVELSELHRLRLPATLAFSYRVLTAHCADC